MKSVWIYVVPDGAVARHAELVVAIRSEIKVRLRNWRDQKPTPIPFDVHVSEDADGQSLGSRDEPHKSSDSIIVNLVSHNGNRTENEEPGEETGCCDQCEARFDLKVDELRRDGTANKDCRIGPKPVDLVDELREECADEAVKLVDRLDHLMQNQMRVFTRKMMIWGLVVAIVTFIAACIQVLQNTDKAPPVTVTESGAAEPLPHAQLLIKQPSKAYTGLSEDVTANSRAPAVGTELLLGVGGSPDFGVVLVVGIEGEDVYVVDDLSQAQTWTLDAPGTVTLLSLTLEADVGAVDPKQLAQRLERALKDELEFPVPDLSEHLHAVWNQRSFEFREGTGSRGPRESDKPTFRDWANRVFDVIGEVAGQRWAVSGRSFRVVESDE